MRLVTAKEYSLLRKGAADDVTSECVQRRGNQLRPEGR